MMTWSQSLWCERVYGDMEPNPLTHRGLSHVLQLRHMARIGDFREAHISPELVSEFGSEDGLTNVR